MKLDITKRSIKIKKNKITYEHPVPSKVVFNLIMAAKNESEILNILEETDCIVILSHSEDQKLRDRGLISSMPKGWSYGDNIFARYEKANIEVLPKRY
jgi:tetrahydromethanopterin S-methyltransferase subunit H